ncbi:MAG: hypothetical protein MZV63_16235, partial [Marinilabiliales bacterium]|nr:hypothetical protein [Marinilabiliales bacterium]
LYFVQLRLLLRLNQADYKQNRQHLFMLRIININTFYGGNIQALKNVSLHVQEQEIVVLIGANGAGKQRC